MKKALALLLVFASLSIVLVSCGGNEVVGTWEYKYEGETLMTITFEKGGEGYLEVLGEKEEFEWEIDGDKLIMTADGEKEETEYKVEDDKLTLEIEGEKLTFEKKD